MRIISYITAVLVILLGLSFALLNATPVKLNYYVGASNISLSLLLVLTVGVGIAVGFLASLSPIFKLKRKNYKLKTRVKQLEQEMLATRIAPEIKD